MKLIKKFSLSILVLTLVSLFTFNAINVFASYDKYANFGATYQIKEVVDEYDFGYGITFQREISTSSVTQGGLTTGITLNNDSPQQAHVLTVKPSDDVELVPYTFLSGPQWSATTVKKAALQYEATHPGYRVVAAVNGDFFQISHTYKASTGVTIGQGEYYKSISHHGGIHTLAIRNNGEGKQLFVANIDKSYPVLSIYDNDGNVIKKFDINKVNNEPGDNEVALYYAPLKKNFEPQVNPINVKDAWLVRSGLYATTTCEGSFYGVGNITEFLSEELALKANQFAIKSNNKQVTDMLAADVKIRVQFEYKDASVEGVENFIGFPYQLVENGKYIANKHPDDNNVKYRHPRTIIGQKENGDVVLAVVDGRQNNKNMYGLSAVEMSTFMAAHGCVDAWNLDGGGSSTMIVRKQYGWEFGNENNGFNKDNSDWYVTNNPSDGSERSDGNHLLVVVKLPDVKFDLKSATETSITINVALLTDLDKHKELYVLLEGKYYPVEGEEVKITDLKKNTDYEVFLYSKIDGNYINLMTSKTFSTNKSAPTSISIVATLYEKNGVQQIQFRYTVDKDEAVRTIVFIGSDGERFLTASKIVFIEKTLENLQSIINGKVEINFLANEAFPEETLILEDFEIKFDTMFVFDEMLYTTDETMKDLFK